MRLATICTIVLLGAATASARVIAPAYTLPATKTLTGPRGPAIRTVENPAYESAHEVIRIADALIASGENYQANEVISDWVIANTDKMDMYLAAQFFSRYDLAITVGGVVALQELIALIDLLTPAQKSDMMPVLIQLKTRYDLLKGEDDPELLLGIPGTHIPVVRVGITDIPTTVVDGVTIAHLSIEHLSMGLTGLPRNVIKVVRINGIDFPLTVIHGRIYIEAGINFSRVDWQEITGTHVVTLIVNAGTVIDWSRIPSNVIILMRLSTDTLDLIARYENVYAGARMIMGDYGLHTPHPNTPAQLRFRKLMARIEQAGITWGEDAELVERWLAYWRDLKISMDRRAMVPNRP